MRRTEILAPVGSAEMLPAAVYAGANAVYLGLQGFNARVGAGNFTASQLAEAVTFCHARGVKVYVTMNTVLFARELPAFAEAARAVAAAGADAVLVQDMAARDILQKTVPALPLHASTQMSIHNIAGARKAKELGFTRVVLAREMSLADIKAVHDAVDIELEAFVHGALCMSVSGQCYMSAFLGGRSGNRGACAGPCRLPFSANGGEGFHLSLKDMSAVAMLPQLADAGVTSAKIEGRLRTPEYVAAAVNACVCARDGQPYDAALLQDVFSRSGFTDGYLQGKINGDMFGVRTQADAAAAKAALPKLRELYRRERPCVPVCMTLSLTKDGAQLTVRDENGHTVQKNGTIPPAPANTPQDYTKALGKTGGTPFYAQGISVLSGVDLYVPNAEINELRRAALEELLAVRSTPTPLPYHEVQLLPLVRRTQTPQKVAARFETVAQLPQGSTLKNVDILVLPLTEWQNVPQALRTKTVLWLPRISFGAAEQQMEKLISAAEGNGFLGYTAENLAHFSLLQGKPIYGGFGLNITNPTAFSTYASMGAKALTVSAECTLTDVSLMGHEAQSTLFCYGHMPLMLTRACPLQNVRTCDGCSKEGVLTDRKGMQMPVRCRDGMRTVYNPVPLYMGDRLREVNADIALAYFTVETQQRAEEVLQLLQRGAAFDGDYTRGLYYKGVSE